jgi:hypothetical protein
MAEKGPEHKLILECVRSFMQAVDRARVSCAIMEERFRDMPVEQIVLATDADLCRPLLDAAKAAAAVHHSFIMVEKMLRQRIADLYQLPDYTPEQLCPYKLN